VFGTRFVLGFLEGCITNEYLALFAPESGLDRFTLSADAELSSCKDDPEEGSGTG
jgi:hypothetical protein